MTKLLLLDKDGTLVQPRAGKGFVQAPWDQQPFTRAIQMLRSYSFTGWLPVIVSNQGGIASGYKSLEATFFEMQYALKELFPALIKEAYFCPDFEGMECWRCWDDCLEKHRIHRQRNNDEDGFPFRKPSPGMLQMAMEIYSPTDVLMVGDRHEDQQAAQAANIPFMWADKWRGDGNP